MSKTETIDPADVICGLKAAVTALECYHGMELLKQQEHVKKIEKTPPPPMYMMIPIEEKKPEKKLHVRKSTCHTEEELKEKHVKNGKYGTISGRQCVNKKVSEIHCDDPSDIPCLIFPEMRGGILFDRCSCVHRDGLQDSCPLTQCQGQPECVTKPWPICPPGKFTRKRFPELFPMPESCKSV